MSAPQTFTPRQLRFISKVDNWGGDGCWLWRRGLTQWDQPIFWDGTRKVIGSRYAWSMFNGPIPEGKSILHSCDTPRCVNPSHLRVGTQAENMRDMTERKRGWAGLTHCLRGHALSGDNLRLREREGATHRVCRTCDAYRQRQAKARKA